MVNAQKMIEERKKALSVLRTDSRHKGLEPPSASVQRTEEKAKKIAQLQVPKYFQYQLLICRV